MYVYTKIYLCMYIYIWIIVCNNQQSCIRSVSSLHGMFLSESCLFAVSYQVERAARGVLLYWRGNHTYVLDVVYFSWVSFIKNYNIMISIQNFCWFFYSLMCLCVCSFFLLTLLNTAVRMKMLILLTISGEETRDLSINYYARPLKIL
jgi:hypothetical protein